MVADFDDFLRWNVYREAENKRAPTTERRVPRKQKSIRMNRSDTSSPGRRIFVFGGF